jgi:hypothetical protein
MAPPLPQSFLMSQTTEGLDSKLHVMTLAHPHGECRSSKHAVRRVLIRMALARSLWTLQLRLQVLCEIWV